MNIFSLRTVFVLTRRYSHRDRWALLLLMLVIHWPTDAAPRKATRTSAVQPPVLFHRATAGTADWFHPDPNGTTLPDPIAHPFGHVYHGVDRQARPRTTFMLWAPKAERVTFHATPPSGEPITRDVPQVKGAPGFFVFAAPVGPGTRYRYESVLAGKAKPHVCPDPYALALTPDKKYSLVIDRAQDVSRRPRSSAWLGRTAADLHAIAQVHPLTHGKLPGITRHLTEYTDLGFDGVLLMPIFWAAGDRNIGYDVMGHLAINPNIANRSQFVDLLAQAHRRGIAVGIDVTTGHAHDRSPLLALTPIYEGVDGPWGKQPLVTGRHAKTVERYISEVIYRWAELGADLFRFDAVHAIPDEINRANVRAVQQAAKQLDRPLIACAEHNQQDRAVVVPQAEGGFGYDIQYASDTYHAGMVVALADQARTKLRERWMDQYHEGDPILNYTRSRRRGFGLSTKTAVPAVASVLHSRVDPWNYLILGEYHDGPMNRVGIRAAAQRTPQQERAHHLTVAFSPMTALWFQGSWLGKGYANELFPFIMDPGDLDHIGALRDRINTVFGIWIEHYAAYGVKPPWDPTFQLRDANGKPRWQHNPEDPSAVLTWEDKRHVWMAPRVNALGFPAQSGPIPMVDWPRYHAQHLFGDHGPLLADPAADDLVQRVSYDPKRKGDPEMSAQYARLFRTLNKSLRQFPALQQRSWAQYQVVAWPNRRVSLERRWSIDGKDDWLLIHNTSGAAQTISLTRTGAEIQGQRGQIIPLDEGTTEAERPYPEQWRRYLYSEARKFGGIGITRGQRKTLTLANARQPQASITLHPGEAILYHAVR